VLADKIGVHGAARVGDKQRLSSSPDQLLAVELLSCGAIGKDGVGVHHERIPKVGKSAMPSAMLFVMYVR